ncbi:MAG TPA: prenyltransferase/squalene oxidase repeat-containing protein [Solirubrobacteraceae bacterium]
MFRRSIISAAVATLVGALALGVVSTALAAASRPNVTIRIEGAKRTLVPGTTVRAPGRGWITKDGAPKGKCPADSAAGALKLATHGAWSGTWSSKYDDYLIRKILGDTESGAKSYWEILVNNVAASTGACQIKLRAGMRLLFAAMPLTGTGYPLVIKAPRTATAGAPLKVAVDYVNAKGAAKPLAGAIVRTSGGVTATTNTNGIVTMRPKHRGKVTLRAHKAGYVRAAARTVKVRSRARAARAAVSPLAYLLSAQNHDGGYGFARGQPSSALYSGWAALALVADRRNPAHVAHGGRSLLAYLKATVAHDPGSLERTILVAGAAGVPATNFGGHNLLAALKRDIRPNGSVRGHVNLTTFAILALRAAGVPPPARMVRWLVHQQDANGGFSFAKRGDLADVDDTGAALEGLAGTSDHRAQRRAVAFVRAAQSRDGGFPAQPGGSSNAQSTAWAVQGLTAAGVNPARVHTHGAPSPLHYLRSLVTRRGAIDYSRGVSLTPVWVTAQAILALDRKPFPLRPLTNR